MLKPIFEGQIDIFLSSDVELTAGQLVKLDSTAGKIVPAGAGDTVYGIVAQDVVDGNVDNFKLDSVTHKAKLGDKVGVYFNGGIYLTDQYSGNVNFGQKLYAGANGQLVTTASGNVVATALTAGNSANGDKIKIRLEV